MGCCSAKPKKQQIISEAPIKIEVRKTCETEVEVIRSTSFDLEKYRIEFLDSVEPECEEKLRPV
jgi:hypothetical protein